MIVSSIAFTVENDTLTPTQKLKRYQAGKMYEAELQRLYKQPIPDLKAKAAK